MDQGKGSKVILYIITLALMFLIPFSLDQLFGFHYEPEPLNQEVLKYHIPLESNEPLEKEEENKYTAHQPEVKLEETTEDSIEITEKNKETELKETVASFFDGLLDKYRTEIIADLPENKARTDIVIRYYRHPPDGNGPYALEKLSFYIHERPIAQGLENFQSNAIYYGDSVRLEDIQIVAYTLLKEGLPIKLIKESKFSNSWKSKSIEIGTDTTLVDLPTLQLDQIQNLNL